MFFTQSTPNSHNKSTTSGNKRKVKVNGNLERGWNDPPVMLHSPEGLPPTGPTVSKRTPLNKRVAYPADMASTNTPTSENLSLLPPKTATTIAVTSLTCDVLSVAPPTSSMPGVVLLPPTSTTEVPRFTAPIIVPQMNSGCSATLPIVGSPTATNPITNTQVNVVDNLEDELPIPNFDDDTQMFHYTMSKLQKTLLDVRDRLQPKVVETVSKKLEVLSIMWQSGAISYEVKSSMARLATALHRRRCELADRIHMTLMMDCVAEVGTWMVGVKRLIQEAQSVQAPLSPSDTTVNRPSSESDLSAQSSSRGLVALAPQDTESNDSRVTEALGEPSVNEIQSTANNTELQALTLPDSQETVQDNLSSTINSTETNLQESDTCTNNQRTVTDECIEPNVDTTTGSSKNSLEQQEDSTVNQIETTTLEAPL